VVVPDSFWDNLSVPLSRVKRWDW